MDKRETEKVESGAFTFSSFSKTRKTSKRSVLINNVKKIMENGEMQPGVRRFCLELSLFYTPMRKPRNLSIVQWVWGKEDVL